MPVIPERVLLKPRVEEFLMYCTARNLSKHTIRAYRADLLEFIALFGGNEVLARHIERKLIRRWVTQLYENSRAPSSVRRKLAAVKQFCSWLEREGLLDANPIESIAGPRRRHRLPDVPNEGDLRRLMHGEISTASPERDRVILELLYGSGLRASELVGINVDDFRDEDILIVRGKGLKERLVIVGECARAAIKAWLAVREKLLATIELETSALLFSVGPRRSAERLDVRSVGRVVKTVAQSRGFDPNKWHPHLLRHACATHMHDHDAPLQAVAALLGHSKLATAQIYTHVSTGRMMRSYKAAHPHARC
jgi:site-specific recombinase XerD